MCAESWCRCAGRSARAATSLAGTCAALRPVVTLRSERPFSVSTSEGDVVLIDCAGAYGRCMASSYNMRDPGPELFLV